jgi:hypothetical protein
MKPTQKETLLFACQNDPEKVAQLIEKNWSELSLDFYLIFERQ